MTHKADFLPLLYNTLVLNEYHFLILKKKLSGQRKSVVYTASKIKYTKWNELEITTPKKKLN